MTRPPRQSARARPARGRGQTSLNRALSKLGILSRSQATAAIRKGRVTVDGRVVTDPLRSVVPEKVRIAVDDEPRRPREWRTLILHKPRGLVTSRHDPQGRQTVFDVVTAGGGDAAGLVAVGRLDLATSGLLILTTDTQLANRLVDPANGVSRVYLVSVRGRVTEDDARRLEQGVGAGAARIHAAVAFVRKASARESHLTIELREGKNREVRRLCEAIGHEITRLKRISFGGLQLGDLEPGCWRELTRDEVEHALGKAAGSGAV